MFIGIIVETLMGQLVFDYFGDKIGRKCVYGITLVLNGRIILQAYSFKEIIQTTDVRYKEKGGSGFMVKEGKEENTLVHSHLLNIG
jgi:MFS family permease